MKKTLILATACIMTSFSVGATLVGSVTDVFGHNEKDNFAGKINDMIIGSGMNGYGDAGSPGWPRGEGDPSTWTATSNGYTSEWQSQDLLAAQTPAEDLDASGVLVGDGVAPGTNGKIGWTILELPLSAILQDLYIWHVRENGNRVARLFNVYVADTPTAAPVHGPTNNTSRDYDFSSGGWTLINTGGALVGTHRTELGGTGGTSVVDLGDTFGRYVGLEILSNNALDPNRVGFAEVAIIIPEPGTLGLLALMGVAVTLIRRRK